MQLERYIYNPVNTIIDTQEYKKVLNPLDQFEIKELINIELPVLDNFKLTITNISLYIVLSGVLLYAKALITNNNEKIKYNKWVIMEKSVFDTVYSIVVSQINKTKGQVFFPFIYFLFIFILLNNLFGMIPYSFATTSHFVLTFSLSFTIVIGATLLGLSKHGLMFFSLFVPKGCPLMLLPLLVLIEFISYLTRNVSLGLRLAANILSGHMLLNILSGFIYNIMNTSFIYFFVSLLPLTFVIAFSGLELGVSFIQSQVFVVLSCSYIKDALELH